MATIEMTLELQAEIGIAPHEQGGAQALKVELRVQVADPLSDAAAASGDIRDTIDYGELREIVHQVLGQRRHKLLEEVTTAIRGRILALDHVTAARVAVTKFSPWADVPQLRMTR